MAAVLERSISTDISENLLECPICHSQFIKPKVLSCQHSFCAKCLKGWIQTRSKSTNSIKCAVCRTATVLPRRGVDDLPENYAIKGLLSLLKERRSKTVKSESTMGAAAPTEKIPSEKMTEQGSSIVAQKSVKRSEKKAEKGGAVPPATASKKTGISGAGSAGKKDENANMSRSGKKASNQRGGKKKVELAEASPVASSSSECEDCDTSSEEDYSDDFSDDDSEFSTSSDDESGDSSSGEESDVPPTPTLKSYGEIKVGMKVYVFNKRGKRFVGRVKLLETCTLGRLKQRRTYAGVELSRENTNLTTCDMEDIEESYLYYWLEENENPCAVVRADDCMPAGLVDRLVGEQPSAE